MEHHPGSIVVIEAPRRDGLPALRRGEVVAASGLLLGLVLRPGTLAELRASIGEHVVIGRPGAGEGSPHTVLAARAGRDGLVVADAAPRVRSGGDRRRHPRVRVAGAALVDGTNRAPIADLGAGGLRLGEPVTPSPGPWRVVIGHHELEVAGEMIDAHRLRFAAPVDDLDAHDLVRALTLELSRGG